LIHFIKRLIQCQNLKVEVLRSLVVKNKNLLHEYSNQRAWLGSGSVKPYQGLKQFHADRFKASKKNKADFEPKKSVVNAFNKAVEYAEGLKNFSDYDRLEKVLLRYGWDFVDEKESEQTMQDSKTCKMNQSSDNEHDPSQLSAVKVDDNSKGSKSRRSSGGEAESKIDPVNDEELVTPDQVATKKANGSKRENGSKGEGFPVNKKAKTNNSVDKSQNAEEVESEKVGIEDKKENDFPMIGDLVWGRMPGFPWWPSFVTRNPENIYKKPVAKGKLQYHVQFFGWNDESGWVTSVMSFEGIEVFNAMKAKKKSDKSFNPGRGAQLKKWEKAVSEAEDCQGMTRQERIDQFFVSYAHKVDPPSTTPKSSKTSNSKSASSNSKVLSAETSVVKTSKTSKSSSKIGSTVKTDKNVVPVKNYLGSKKRMSVPPGWHSKKVILKGKEQVVYISPDSQEFTSKAAMYKEISNKKNGAQDVKYLHDPSLPEGWRCQLVMSCLYFFSPLGERFESRDEVAQRMKSDGQHSESDIEKFLSAQRCMKPAPKSVKIARGQVDLSQSEKDILLLPNGLKFRRGGIYEARLDLNRIFDESNGGKIDLVQLPDIFLEHPTVIVEEADNEMIIKDVDTLEFIAKKIIYE